MGAGTPAAGSLDIFTPPKVTLVAPTDALEHGNPNAKGAASNLLTEGPNGAGDLYTTSRSLLGY